MPGLTIQYGWHICNQDIQFLRYYVLRVFLVNIVRQFQPDIPRELVSSGLLIHYGLNIGTRVENRKK
jgi:hypothetical protein